nr:replication protein A 70 kDa DNA-binding subunit B [Tanacetum cinerariifolium]
MNWFPNKNGLKFGYQKTPTVASNNFGSSSYRKDKVVAIGDIVLVQSGAGRKIRRTVVVEDSDSRYLCSPFQNLVVTIAEFFNGAVKKMVSSTRECDQKSHCIVYTRSNRIHKENIWAYTACKECNKKVNVVESKAMSSAGKSKVTFYYEDHGVVHVAYRYTTWELMEKHDMDVNEYWTGDLLDLLGKRFLFKLYYSDYNVNNNHTYRCDVVNDEPAFVKHFREGFLDDEDDDEGFTTPASQIKVTNFGDHSLNHALDMQTPTSGIEASGSGKSSDSKRVFIDLDDIDSEKDEEGRSNKTPKLLTVKVKKEYP